MKQQYGKLFTHESLGSEIKSRDAFSSLSRLKAEDAKQADSLPTSDADTKIRGWCAALKMVAPLFLSGSVSEQVANQKVKDVVESARLVESALAKRSVGVGAQMPRHTYMRRTVTALVVDQLIANPGCKPGAVAKSVTDIFDSVADESWFVASFGEDVKGGFDETVALTCSCMNAVASIQKAVGPNATQSDIKFCLEVTQSVATHINEGALVHGGSPEASQMLAQNSIKNATEIVAGVIAAADRPINPSNIKISCFDRAKTLVDGASLFAQFGASLLDRKRISDSNKAVDNSESGQAKEENRIAANPCEAGLPTVGII